MTPRALGCSMAFGLALWLVIGFFIWALFW
jgi:hypothetical protein